MVTSSTQNTRNVNQSNGNNANNDNNINNSLFPKYDKEYEIGGLKFPTFEFYELIDLINNRLSFFYTETGEERDYEPICDSFTRRYDYEEFNEFCDHIKEFIVELTQIIKKDDRASEFLYKYRLSSKFSALFKAINYAFYEQWSSSGEFDPIDEIKRKKHQKIRRKQYKKIKKIVIALKYLGVDPITPLMI